MQYPSDFGGKIIWNSALFAEMDTSSHPGANSEVAKRLRALRYYVAGNNQTVFATKMNIDVKRWNNFERESPPVQGNSFPSSR